jgi:NodT family efflux transporter outer membrane factor (OMF) lipoprotein
MKNGFQKSRGVVLKLLFPAVLGMGLCQGCITVGPDYIPPVPEVPDTWHQELTRGLAEGEASLQTWWKSLNDLVLDSLIERAGAGNLDLKEATARIMEARARRGIAAGEFFPDIDASGSAERSRTSEDFFPGRVDGKRTGYTYGLGIGGSWEVDFWGRIRRLVESADAGLLASVEDYRDVQVLLFAEVALNYVQVRTLQTRIRFAEDNVEAQRSSLKITEARFKAEIAGELDVHQAELNLARTESIIPTLRSLMTRSINRLGVLLGEFPSALHDELTKEAPIPKPQNEIIVSLPANLLRQRPDIRKAERELAAQTASIGVATSELYPRFFLLGDFGFEGTKDILDYKKRAWSFGPTFRWNIFDGGRVRSFIKVEEALTEQALVRYEQTVLEAMEDVENSLVAYAEESSRREILEGSVEAAHKSAELVKVLYITGLTDFQNVLDMEKSLFEQQDDFATSEGSVTQNLIRVYRSLGGGWKIENGPSAEN